MEYLKVEGNNNLIRDPFTNAIINTNMTEYQQYVSRRDVKNKENQKLENLESDVTNIKNDLDEIKMLLRSLIDGSR